jgi:DNA-binding NarL/FixJ family response regulator
LRCQQARYFQGSRDCAEQSLGRIDRHGSSVAPIVICKVGPRSWSHSMAKRAATENGSQWQAAHQLKKSADQGLGREDSSLIDRSPRRRPSSVSRAPSVLIVDDQPDIVSSLERRLHRRHYRVLTPVTDLQRLAAQLKRQPPDVLLLDIMMRNENALLRLKRLRATAPHTRFLVYTGFDDPALLMMALREGADGYLLKLFPEELFPGIETVLAGMRYIAMQLRPAFDGLSQRAVPRTFTAAQRELFELLHAGIRQADIAQRLHVSLRTIERRVTNLAAKLGIARATYHIGWEQVAGPTAGNP